MSEVSELAVEIAKSRYAKEKKENELMKKQAKEQAENCAKLIFEVFKVDCVLQVAVKSRTEKLACGVKTIPWESKFAFLEDFDWRKGNKTLHEAMDTIYRLKAIPNTVEYILDLLSHDKDIIKYYSIEYDDKIGAVIVALKDMNELETVCENEESAE